MNVNVDTGPLKVYRAITAITGELAKVGIAKGRKNTQQGYQFRGIDDVYAALSTLLNHYQLCVIPRVLSRSTTERQTKSGGTLLYTVVDVEYDLVSADDGSKHTARVVGEAMDSGDKSSNKAMSAAYKYFALQTFCIPTEGDNDADAHTHEPAPNLPPGYEDWQADMVAKAEEGVPALQEAWKKSPGDYRALASNSPWWIAVKGRATKSNGAAHADH